MAKTYKLKPQDGKVKFDLPPGDYLIVEEITDAGVVIITCTPSDQIKKEVESKLNGVKGEVATLEIQGDEIDDILTAKQTEQAELQTILDGL